MGLSGHATVEGTARFRDRAVGERDLPPDHFRVEPGGLALTSLGLGTYIGSPDGPTDLAVEQSVSICLTSGRANVLDTAINYRYQRAERSVGRALSAQVEKGALTRDEVFLATKNGYLAPDADSKAPLDEWVERELIAPGILDPAEIVDGSHSMALPYLRDQLERSRRNLGVETIDLLYLHNAPDAQLPVVGTDLFLARLEEAFGLYERLRDDGAISRYGLATWESLRVPGSHPTHLSLEAAVGVARKVGGDGHGFRFIQFPFNLVMTEAWTAANQPVGGTRLSLFRAASKLGIGCFTSVPLLQGRLARGGPRKPGFSSAQTALQFARSAPGTLGPMVGQKGAEHISENLEVAARQPWDEPTFESLLS